VYVYIYTTRSFRGRKKGHRRKKENTKNGRAYCTGKQMRVYKLVRHECRKTTRNAYETTGRKRRRDMYLYIHTVEIKKKKKRFYASDGFEGNLGINLGDGVGALAPVAADVISPARDRSSAAAAAARLFIFDRRRTCVRARRACVRVTRQRSKINCVSTAMSFLPRPLIYGPKRCATPVRPRAYITIIIRIHTYIYIYIYTFFRQISICW